MLGILQAWRQQNVNQELRDIEAGFRKGRGTRDQIANIWSWKKQGVSRKTSAAAPSTALKLVCGSQQTGKLLTETGPPDHRTCLLRNLHTGQEAVVRTGRGTAKWFQIGKGCILSPCLFNFYAEYIMWNAGLVESQTRIKIAERNINNLR